MRAAAVLFGVICLCLFRPAPVLAHAVLRLAEPAPGSVLAVPTDSIRLLFSESVQPVSAGIIVRGTSGKAVETGRARANGALLIAGIDATEPGTYTVTWEVVSADTHPARGRFSFSVGRVTEASAASAFGQDVASVSLLGLVLQVLGRWLHYAGFALAFGTVAFRTLVLRRVGVSEVGAGRLWSLVSIGIVVLLAAELVALIGQTASLGTGQAFDVRAVGDALASPFGRVSAQRAGAALLLWVLAGAVRQGAEPAATGMLVLAGVVAFVDGEASHAITSRPAAVAVTLNAVHVAAMGIWIGGLVSLLVVWRLPGLEPSRPQIAARFGRIAVMCVAALVVSGLFAAAVHLSSLTDLGTTGYGRALDAKLAILCLALATAFIGRRASSNSARWWLFEGAGMALVLLLAGLLVSLPPAA